MLQSSATFVSTWKSFLGKPVPEQCKDHVVQFYDSQAFLSDAVSHFIGAGLDQGEAVIIIARAEHALAFRQELKAKGYDVEDAAGSGQLKFLDASETLSKFMTDGLPDWERFHSLIGGLVEKTQARFAKVRAYGEMVDILRTDGNTQGMIALESHWNDLAKSHSFSLLCGYMLSGFRHEESANAFEDVCRSHTHVLPSESFTSIQDEGCRNREIALLQRKAAALEAEIEERKRAERELQEAVRMRDEFLSIASHELKTPITSLKLQAQLFQRRFERNDAALSDRKNLGKLVETTTRQVDRLDKLIDSMLDISRISHGKLYIDPEEVDLGELVRDVVDRFSEQLKAQGCRHRLTVETSIIGHWDRYRLEQVVTNLITNAMKYASGKPIEISVTAEGERAIMRVKDQGAGISKDNLRRIFDRFERAIAASEVSGLGLGLYISRQIVEAHRGRIWTESEPGNGATFVVDLPLSQAPR